MENRQAFLWKEQSKMAKTIVYSTKICPWCRVAKDFLAENNVEFEEKDVGEDAAARDEMVKKTGSMSVPVLDIDGTIIVGFDKEAIKKALNIQ